MSYYAIKQSFLSQVLETGSSACFFCNQTFDNANLKLDHIYVDKKICKTCYYNRHCEKCGLKCDLFEMMEGDYNVEHTLVCKPCSVYTRNACDRCKRGYYTFELQLTSDGDLCESCIDIISYENDSDEM